MIAIISLLLFVKKVQIFGLKVRFREFERSILTNCIIGFPDIGPENRLANVFRSQITINCILNTGQSVVANLANKCTIIFRLDNFD